MSKQLFHKIIPVYRKLLFLIIISTMSPATLLATPTTDLIEKSTPESDITAHVSPDARLRIYSSVALFPVINSDGNINEKLTAAFYQAMMEMDKYQIIPIQTSKNWFTKHHMADGRFSDPSQIARQAARELGVDGIITASLSSHLKNEITADTFLVTPTLTASFSMLDTSTQKQIWSVAISVSDHKQQTAIPPQQQITNAITDAVTSLQEKMVAKGDIFSTLLPKPEILSTQGGIRSIRIVLQPEPPHIFSRYQLLRAEQAQGIFSPAGPPVDNKAPVILTDKELKDATPYFYTVIGLTEKGFANVPEAPVKIITTGQPAPISILHASCGGIRQVKLFWEPSPEPTVIGYTIFRSNNGDGIFTKVAEINSREKQIWVDRGQSERYHRYGILKDNATYFYTIRTRNVVGVQSVDSPVASATTTGAPQPPTNLQAISNQPGKIPLTWTAAANPEITEYVIYRAKRPDGPFHQIDYISGRESQQFTDKGSWEYPLSNATTYWYRLRSLNVVEVKSNDSLTASATTKAAPAQVTALKATNGLFRHISLSWLANTEPDIKHYEIYRGSTKDNISSSIGRVQAYETTSFTDTTLNDGRSYWYQVRAVDRDNLDGELSIIVTGTTKHPPVRPSNLQAEFNDTSVLLSWQQNPEKDINFYEISKGGFFSRVTGTSVEPFFLYRHEEEPQTEISFMVRAVDSDGLKSEYSEQVTIVIPYKQ